MEKEKVGFFKKFPSQFWLVVIFEFFERGSYYGMMSFISVYFTDTLNIPKESVGVIKGVIQPLLYFLPIISGAIADRFGYRKILMMAFTLLGGGYFLTSQMTTYSSVFIALVVMGFGAGMFKPIISGTIARVTDESNSTQAFEPISVRSGQHGISGSQVCRKARGRRRGQSLRGHAGKAVAGGCEGLGGECAE